jgi:hypothetical protein
MNNQISLRFLAIGSNEFECACNLRDFIDRATRNAKYHYCSQRKRRSIISWNMPEHQYNVLLREYHSLITSTLESYLNMIGSDSMNLEIRPYRLKALTLDAQNTELRRINEDECYNFDFNEETHMNFNFMLLDYNENDYKCVKYEENINHVPIRRQMHFSEVESCFIDTTGPYDGSSDDEYEETTPDRDSPNSTTPSDGDNDNNNSYDDIDAQFLYILFLIPISLFAILWYWKRADIKYFFAVFKNSLILSLDKEDKKTLMMTNRRKSANANDHFTYDVFVSYSDKDRTWVLDELIPNIEKRAEINICLHERDFQVGLGILENIIQCMDKSRCLLLVISESFLKSNWCAFEMHLAQHR